MVRVDKSGAAFGEFVAVGTLVVERLLPGPIERVWAYITEPEACAQWLATIESDLAVGSKIRLHFNHERLTPHDEETPHEHEEQECAGVNGTVLECEYCSVFRFGWNWGDKTSEVTFRLTRQGDEVLLKITHTNISLLEDMVCIGAGWHTHLGILQAKLQGRVPDPFWSVFEEMKEEYENRLQAVAT